MMMQRKAQLGFSLIELMIVVTILGILAMIALPAYQDYVARSQASRGMYEAAALKTRVDFCATNGMTTGVGQGVNLCDPEAIGSTILQGSTQGNISNPNGTGVPQVSFVSTGAASVVATFGNAAVGELTGDSITWSRTSAGVWSCNSNIDPSKYRPRGCN
jgi:type IV pilus assembly protein PilA